MHWKVSLVLKYGVFSILLILIQFSFPWGQENKLYFLIFTFSKQFFNESLDFCNRLGSCADPGIFVRGGGGGPGQSDKKSSDNVF